MKDLRGLQNLTVLSITHCRVGDAGVSELKAFPKLVELNLIGTRITEASLKDLAELRELTRLDLRNTRACGAGLAELKACKNLSILNIELSQPREPNGRPESAKRAKTSGTPNVNGREATRFGAELMKLKQSCPGLEINREGELEDIYR